MQEGFYADPPARARRNNNPGNIMWDGPDGFAARNGAVHGDNGPHTPMAVFPDLLTGYHAFRKLLNVPATFAHDGKLVSGYVGATFEQVIHRYCPGDAPGNTPALTEQYVRNVETWTGHKRTERLTVEMI